MLNIKLKYCLLLFQSETLFLFFLFYITLALSRKLFSKIVEIQKVVEELRADQKLMAEDISKLKISMAANDKEYIDVINFYFV
jgi:hypothetical protein